MEDRPFVESLKGMRIGGRYVVEKVLGSGGMGVVATARYPELQQKVAIKFLRPEHAASSILNARFMREGRLAARVKSEHFVRVFDIGKLPTGVPYLVMELLSGHDLADELIANGAMPIETALEWVLQALIGLAEIHSLGIVHRDLKPSNLFISEAAGKRMVKVLDFGISKESSKTDSGAPLTSTDNLLGTPQYMSPEQVRASKDVDARSDIWAVGVILYELLTARRPFVSDENATGELFAKVLYIDPVKPREHRPAIPVELEAVIMRCLARDRAERYPDVGALAEALRAFIAPSSALHIDAVKQALTSRSSLVPPSMEEEESIDDRPVSQLATASSSPDAKRASGSNSGPQEQAPVTAMTSATGSTQRVPRHSAKSNATVFAIGAAVVAVGLGAYVVSSRRAPPAPVPAVASSPPPPVASPAPVAAAPPPSETASAPAPVVSPSSAPSASAVPAIERPRPAVVAAPRPRPQPSAPPAPPSTGSLIQDRK